MNSDWVVMQYSTAES